MTDDSDLAYPALPTAPHQPARPVYGDSFIPSFPPEMPVPYNGPFRAKVISIHDGDTVDLDVSLCFDCRKELTVRLFGMNAPELSTPEGVVARDFLRTLLPIGSWVRFTPLLSSVGQVVETFGRTVGRIEAVDHGQVFDVAATMVGAGMARWCDRNLKPLAGPPSPIKTWLPPGG